MINRFVNIPLLSVSTVSLQADEKGKMTLFTQSDLPEKMLFRRFSKKSTSGMAVDLFSAIHFAEKYSEPVVIVMSVEGGDGHFTPAVDHHGGKLRFGSGDALFLHSNHLDGCVTIDATKDIKFSLLIITVASLLKLLGEDVTKKLEMVIPEFTTPALHSIPHHIQGLLSSCLPNHLTGKLQILFTQARILEYIGALAEYFVNLAVTQQPEVSAKSALIRQIHTDVTLMEGKQLKIDELARIYGLTERILNKEFSKMYGSTVINYFTKQRLINCRKQLLTTNIPMKVMATRCGYSHVNHFIRAFKKQFNCSPGSLRKQNPSSN